MIMYIMNMLIVFLHAEHISCRGSGGQAHQRKETREGNASQPLRTLGIPHHAPLRQETKPKEEEEWKPWDRDEMSQRQMSSEARASVLRKAKEFNTRFAPQSGSRFL